MIRALFSVKGSTPIPLRQAIAAYGENDAGIPQEIGEIPVELRPYLDKVNRYAYKVTDKDIARLKEAGYSEAAIYEITVSAAMGAGLGRMKRGLLALHEGKA
jgi:hypothetical protein